MRAAFTRAVVVLTVVAVAVVGCSSSEPSTKLSLQKRWKLSGLPAEMTVKQRSTTAVPGSEGALRLTIDDVTGGQVIASLTDEDGRAVLGPTSMTDGTSAAFLWGDDTYRLTLRELNNALVGEDFAAFVISSGAAGGSMSDQDKIERLLSAVESAEGDVFYPQRHRAFGKGSGRTPAARNGATGTQIATVEVFIDKIGTKSSLSNEPYRVRRADGREVPAGGYLRDKLREIEASVGAIDSVR